MATGVSNLVCEISSEQSRFRLFLKLRPRASRTTAELVKKAHALVVATFFFHKLLCQQRILHPSSNYASFKLYRQQ